MQKFILKVAATSEVTREEFNAEDSLGQLQSAVGGFIERVPVALVGQKDLYVNEDGRQKKLPYNEKLTAFVNCRRRNMPIDLVGDGVFAAHNGEGETRGLTEAECADLEKAIERSVALSKRR